jgi:hypothetical protein
MEDATFTIDPQLAMRIIAERPLASVRLIKQVQSQKGKHTWIW